MSSLTDELTRTRTAQWQRNARASRYSAAWKTRELCFAALERALEADGHQGEASPPSLSAIARLISAAPATLYNWWGTDQGMQTISRWAGSDPAIKPGSAFVAETKVVSFWPYRQGCLSVASAFDLDLTELISAYLRALGTWAGDRPALARCRPSAPPGCVAEDLAVAARVAADSRPASQQEFARRVGSLASEIIASVARDPSLTPTGALHLVQEDLLLLVALPRDRLADRVETVLNELADQVVHCADDALAHASQIRRSIERARLILPSARPGPTVASIAGSHDR